MDRKNAGPVDPRLLLGAASVLVAGYLLLGHFEASCPGSVLRYLMFLTL